MKPLQGKRIVVTRPPHKATAFADQLQALGAEAIILPTISIEPLADPSELDEALRQAYDWVIFTSANAVEHMWMRFAAMNIAPQLPPNVAVVGSATAESLQKYGIQADLIPSQHTAEGLCDALFAHGDFHGQRIFLPQGDLARPYLSDHLRAAGAQVKHVVAYRNIRPLMDTASLVQPFDAITFTSSSSIQNFVALYDKPVEVIGAAQVVCIGPIAAQTAHEEGLPVHAIAEPHSLAGLLKTLCHLFRRTKTI